MIKIAIYTAIFGGKDSLRDPFNFRNNDDIDYFCFSDKKIFSNIYKYVFKESIFNNPALDSRYYKVLGNNILDDYDFLIWHDGNIRIDHLKVHDLLRYSAKNFLSVFQHPHRSCFYDESCGCIKRNKDNSFKILKQVFKYRKCNLPSYTGLYETGIMVKNKQFNDLDFCLLWWTHILYNSNRDQLSLCFLAWAERINIGILPGSGTRNFFYKYFYHNSLGFNKSTNKYIRLLIIKLILRIKPDF